MFQFTLKRFLLAMTSLSLTVGYLCLTLKEFVPDGLYFRSWQVMFAGLISGCGFGVTAGFLSGRLWVGAITAIGVWIAGFVIAGFF
jgi:hypothetical protein